MIFQFEKKMKNTTEILKETRDMIKHEKKGLSPMSKDGERLSKVC